MERQLEPIKVLAVANADDTRLLSELLRNAGKESVALTHAAHLGQALGAFRSEGFDAVLLDLNLPDSAGLETLAAARAKAREAPIIVLATHRDEVIATNTMRDGAQDYVVKGEVDGATLLRSIRYAIERHHFQASLRAIEAREEEGRRLRDEQLRHSQKMEAVGRLANGVAHDFNNLLTVIMRYAELLLREAETGRPVTQSDLHEIHNAASTAFALMSQLVALSPQRVSQPKVLSLNDVVLSSMAKMRKAIPKDVEVHITLDAESPRVRADAGQLEQVLLNLVANARDAMPGGGDLTIETSTADVVSNLQQGETSDDRSRYAVVTVSDTGIGMDAETQTRIFEPFFTTKEFGKGIGLGLATVYGIVAQSGGKLNVQSELARGAIFRVYLPCVAEAADTVAPTGTSTNVIGTETLLLVENAAAVRKVLGRALERFGYTILDAPDGQAALTVASRHEATIDLLLTNALLPGVSGRHLADRLRELRPDLRVIFMSGFAGETLQGSGEQETWAFSVQKPFTPKDLARKIREVLDARERGDSTKQP